MPGPGMPTGTVAISRNKVRVCAYHSGQKLGVQRCSQDCAWQQWLTYVSCWNICKHGMCDLTRLLARCGVGAPEAELLGLAAFLCLTGAAAGRLLPANSNASTHSHLLLQSCTKISICSKTHLSHVTAVQSNIRQSVVYSRYCDVQ